MSDDGPGMSEEEQEKIWKKFYRGDESRNDSSSTGLGLAMVRSLTEAHGGSVKVESSPGRGAKFTIRLPL